MFCHINNSISKIKKALGLYLWTLAHFKLLFQKRHFSTVFDMKILCFYDLVFPNKILLFGSLLAYKIIKLTPGYAFLRLKKSV